MQKSLREVLEDMADDIEIDGDKKNTEEEQGIKGFEMLSQNVSVSSFIDDEIKELCEISTTDELKELYELGIISEL